MTFKEQFRQKAEDFSRENRQKMSFSMVFTSLLYRMVKSLDVGVQEVLSYLHDDPRVDCRKQSYSDARQKIKWEGYVELHKDFVREYYADKSELKTYKGLIMMSIDGSTLSLPESQSLAESFGRWKNQGSCRPLARISRAIDVLNLKVLDAQIAGCMTSEMALAKCHLPVVNAYLGAETPKLMLFDRNYPSYYWFGYLESIGNKYVTRIKQDGSIFHQIANSNSLDIVVEVDINTLPRETKNRYLKEEALLGGEAGFPKKLRVRIVKLLREGGDYMILATNLLDSDLYPYTDFEFIYHCRWGSETDYDKLKNVIQVENFSAITPLGILQEFHSATLMQNIASLVIENAQAQIAEEMPEEVAEMSEESRGEAVNTSIQINENQADIPKMSVKKQICFAVAFGLIRNEIWNVIFFDEPLEPIIDRLVEKMKKRNYVPKPDRSFTRKKMRTKAHFPTVKRKVI